MGSVAVELAERIFDHDLSDKTVMILGAGKMGEACVRHLSKKGTRSVLVSNRTSTFVRVQDDSLSSPSPICVKTCPVGS